MGRQSCKVYQKSKDRQMISAIYLTIIALVTCVLYSIVCKRQIAIGGGEFTKDTTTVFKGVAILMIVMGHVGQLVPFSRPFTPLGAIGVALFLLCSGFGIEKSFQKIGRKDYWKKRIINVWLPYALIELLCVWHHPEVGVTGVIEDLLLIRPWHPFGWYMQVLFIWYILYYLTSFLSRRLQIAAFILASILIICFWTPLRAQNSLSFLIGILFARNEAKFLSFANWKSLIVAMILSAGIFVVRERVLRIEGFQETIGWNAFSLVYYMTLATFFYIILIMVCKPSNEKLLRGFYMIGLISYEIYLVHGYTYAYLKSSELIRMLLFCVVTLALSHLYQYGFKKLKTIIKI